MTAAATPLQSAEPLAPAAMWLAVQRRDRAFDGRFFHGVTTTGIYCRPSCPARRPLRRAVAAACAANTVALLVPCHRVIRASGDLAGYRWGLARMRRLLSAERRAGQLPGAASCLDRPWPGDPGRALR